MLGYGAVATAARACRASPSARKTSAQVPSVIVLFIFLFIDSSWYKDLVAWEFATRFVCLTSVPFDELSHGLGLFISDVMHAIPDDFNLDVFAAMSPQSVG
jgi:hypothetical protein